MSKPSSAVKKKLSKKDKILLAVSIVLLVTAGLLLGFVQLLNWSPLADKAVVSGKDHPVSIAENIKTPESEFGKSVNFLVTGIDYAEGTGRAKLTDVILLVCYNISDEEVNILQIPRDTYIGDEYNTGKINAVYGSEVNGGMDGLAKVINDRFALPVDYYMTITMDGFINAIDAIGGVEINVTETLYLEGYAIYPGLQTLDGTLSEIFVRERHGRGSDIARVQSQRAFMSALVKKFLGLSKTKIATMVPSLLGEVTTDLTIGNILDLIDPILKLDPDKMSFYMVPGEGTYVNDYSVWGVHKEKLAEILNEHFRPFSDPVPAEELNLEEIANTIDYYDDNKTTVGEELGD